LHARLLNDQQFATAFAPQLDIMVFTPRAASVTESSAWTRRIFAAAACRDLHLAVAELPVKFFADNLGPMAKDRETVTCLRSVLMKPEHHEWLPRIWELLQDSANETRRV
jgi:hypothetical protein